MSDDETSDDTVVPLKVRMRPDTSKRGELFLASRRPNYSECRHDHGFVLDEANALIECVQCKARIDPLWALRMLAAKEARAFETYKLQKNAAEVLEARRRFNCGHCGKVSVITTDTRHIAKLYKDGA